MVLDSDDRVKPLALVFGMVGVVGFRKRKEGMTMPYGPKGEWRPAGTGACAVHVAKIATGEIEETYAPPRDEAADHVAVSRRASKAGKARATEMTPEQRSTLGKAGAAARWGA